MYSIGDSPPICSKATGRFGLVISTQGKLLCLVLRKPITMSTQNQEAIHEDFTRLEEWEEKHLLAEIARSSRRTSKNMAFFFWCSVISTVCWLVYL